MYMNQRKPYLSVVLLCFLFSANLVCGQQVNFPDCNWIKDVGARTMPLARGVDYNPADFGAVGDGVFMCTEPIQAAIDKCAEQGGGVVRFSTGIYLTGSIFLKFKRRPRYPERGADCRQPGYRRL